MKNLLSRMTVAAMLAASCFVVAGCGGGDQPESAEPAVSTPSDSGSATSTEKAEGSAAKKPAEGSESK